MEKQLNISLDTPVYFLSVSQLLDLLKNNTPEQKSKEEKQEFVYGLDGICGLFGISKKTAIEWKKTWLKPACDQRGRTIIVNKAKALELFNSKNDTK